ncbi:GNAT family N-acetyltransferase [Eisenbergiella tayi]|uniref:GNAT family N-acetyltransferase n=1 Tax=Eisenbergiella tayi TaxID=1432052 RepID=UPI00138E3069|nr:GNAT family N-acetyltransferase [Eisenbergiella tayi]
MIKIDKGNISLAKKLALESSCPSFTSILAGIAKGDLWIDDRENPTLALVYSAPVGGYRIMGEIKNKNKLGEFTRFLEEELFLQLKEAKIDEFEFAAESNEVEKMMLMHFRGYKIIEDKELAFIRKPDQERPVVSEISGYDFLEINEECLQNNYQNKDYIVTRIIEAWGTIEKYQNYGIGFIAVEGDRIAGMILGTANYENILPIDIETLKDHRKKGIATELTRRFLAYCYDNKLTAYWNCIISNVESRNIAEKAGFQFIGSKDYYYFNM